MDHKNAAAYNGAGAAVGVEAPPSEIITRRKSLHDFTVFNFILFTCLSYMTL